MKTNKIELKFNDNTVTSLAGYDYGMSIYNNQVKDKIDFSADKIIIVFPNSKTAIASSFIEGFFCEIKKNIGVLGLQEKIEIESDYPLFVSKIKKSLD